MARIAFIGAGSNVFCRRIVGDLLTEDTLDGSTVALMDIDKERLALSETLLKKLIRHNKKNFRVEATTDRRRALAGADAVVVAIEVGGYEAIQDDLRIPDKYGMKQTVADTAGPGAMFRFLRVVPVLLDICRDMERLCPGAVLLNYSNPMCMNMTVLQQASPIRSLGLCHSVQGLAWQLARAIGKPEEEILYDSAGVNHTAWFCRFEWNGKDAYPLLRAALKENPKAMESLTGTCVDLFWHFGLFPTEGPHHHAEYHPYYLKSDEEIARLGIHINCYMHAFAKGRKERQAQFLKSLRDPKLLELRHSKEYASHIVAALLSHDKPARVHASVMNRGCVSNLPRDVSVEVPIYVDHTGFHPVAVGDLPPGPAGRTAALAYEYACAAKGYLEADRELITQAVLLDPSASAQLTAGQIRSMMRDMFRANEDRLRRLGSALARKGRKG